MAHFLGAATVTIRSCENIEAQKVILIPEIMDISAVFLGEHEATADPMKPDPVVR